MKAHVGTDRSGLVHTLVTTHAGAADVTSGGSRETCPCRAPMTAERREIVRQTAPSGARAVAYKTGGHV